MPVFSMSCFKLPTQIISEITSILQRFWWEKSAEKRGIPWIAWKQLHFTKKQGGLGFRDLEKFHDALLARQVWRIIKHPNTLLAKLFKARYFKDSSILEATPKRKQSYSWSSLLNGIRLLKEGCRYLIADVNKIKVYDDFWIPATPLSKLDHQIGDKSIFVKDLISVHGHSQRWDEDILYRLFTIEERKTISSIHLPILGVCEDEVIWSFEAPGEYTVHSGYRLAMEQAQHNQTAILPPYVNQSLKEKLWKLKILPKLRHFLWRALSLTLKTSTRLQLKGINIDKCCQRCCPEDETINHTMFTCPISISTWRIGQIPSLCNPSSHLETNINNLLIHHSSQHLTEVQRLLPFWLIWGIWRSRNNLLFNKRRPNPELDVKIALGEVQDWLQANKQAEHRLDRSMTLTLQEHWTPPTEYSFKYNYDASYDPHATNVTSGWIVRNYNGDSIFWGSSFLGQARSPLEAEGKALLSSIQLLFISGFKDIIFEGDCLNLTTTIQGDKQFVEIQRFFFGQMVEQEVKDSIVFMCA